MAALFQVPPATSTPCSSLVKDLILCWDAADPSLLGYLGFQAGSCPTHYSMKPRLQGTHHRPFPKLMVAGSRGWGDHLVASTEGRDKPGGAGNITLGGLGHLALGSMAVA